MLHDEISVQEVVDAEVAHEFLKEATKLASSEDLYDTGQRLEEKSRIFAELLAPGELERLDEERLRALLELIFMWRRKAPALLRSNPVEKIRGEIGTLLYGDGTVGIRFERFLGALEGLKMPAALGLGSELLHYAAPERYWLWTHWLWDPKTSGGALPLVLQQEADISAGTTAETYESVGRAIGMVNALGHQEGFSSIAHGQFGTNLFLACVYAVYMYTVFKMRLSKEFNRLLPELPEFTRRILGVYKLNPGVAHV